MSPNLDVEDLEDDTPPEPCEPWEVDEERPSYRWHDSFAGLGMAMLENRAAYLEDVDG